MRQIAKGSSAGSNRNRCNLPCQVNIVSRIRSLTFMVDGKKHVERIPDGWVERIRPLVEQGHEFKDAIAEVFATNAQLLALWRRQSMKKRRRKT